MEAVINAGEKASSQLPVWIAVVDPETDDGREAITQWDRGEPSEWAVPADAEPGDLVLGWLTGGTGFRYLLKITHRPRTASADEHGPQQAKLTMVEPIQPSIAMSRLKGDPGLRRWWPIRSSMQGVVRAQRRSITRDQEWPSFVRMVDTVAPKAAAHLRRDAAAAAKAATQQADDVFEIVSFLDQGATAAVQVTVTRGLANVLARTSAINAKRDGYDLSFSSLLLGVRYGDDAFGKWLAQYVEQQGVRIAHPLSKVGKNADDAAAAAARGVQNRESILSSPLQRTVSARQALEEAARIAEAQSVWPLDTVHLLAAMIGLTNYHETDFGAMSLDRPRWGASFLQCIASQTSDPADISFWQRYYTRRFPGHELPPLKPRPAKGHRPEYDADAYTSTDLLAIDDEVAALASVIASKQTKLPLAIGLFGDWGSGKTFFMKHLRRRIAQLSTGARAQRPEEQECYANIAQIEFNAWHYQEGNLWASLVDHLLRNLRFGDNEDATLLRERRDQLVQQIDDTKVRQEAAAQQSVVADQKVGEAEQRVKDLKQDELNARNELARELSAGQLLTVVRETFTMDPATRQAAEDVARTLNIPAAERTAVELRDALDDAKRELHGVQALFVPLVRAEDRRTRVVYLALALLAPTLGALVIYTLLANEEALARISTIIGGAVTLVGSTAAWLKKQSAWVRETRSTIEPVARRVNRAVDDAIETAVAEQKKAVAQTLATLEELRQQQAAAQKQHDDLAAQSAELKNRLAVLGEGDLMLDFLNDRIGGGVYQQKLGIAALVRRDFERLSYRIEEMTELERGGKVKQKLIINRIVLYIDDLDRCEMDKVVPVLRAVHLLLAFPAFVVVVGVDSRWVARCLQEHLSTVFGANSDDSGRTVTPLDYLEKIFQIPIWLEPVLPDQRVSMARHLLRKPIAPAAKPPVPQPETPPAGAAAPDTESNAPLAADEATHGAHEEDGGGDATANLDAAPPPEAEPVHEPAVDLNPAGLTISDGEYAFLGDLGGLLSSSPRVIKRFVNTYRLMNVTMAQAGMHDPDRQPHDTHIRMLLLAILVDMPDLSRALQEALHESNGFNLAITPLIEALDARYHPDKMTPDREDELEQWRKVRQWMEDRGEPWTTVAAARFSEWLTPVGRYTFNLSRSKAGAGRPKLFIAGLPPAR